MNRFKRVVTLSALSGVMIMGGLSAVSAQDATPMSLEAVECTIAPTTVEALQALYGTPAAAGESEANSLARSATPEALQLPEGTPADEATTAAITATVQMIFACNNSGMLLSSMATLSEHFISTEIGNAVFDEDLVAVLQASPVAVPAENQTLLLDVRDVTVYADGRVGALIDYMAQDGATEGIEGQETDLFIFVNVDGVWLLDDSFENLEGLYGPAATPAA
jgi:hypothetical protein